MKKLQILFAFLMGISEVVASAPHSDVEGEFLAAGSVVHYDFQTIYSLVKATAVDSDECYEIRNKKDGLVSSFSLEKSHDGKVLIKNFNPAKIDRAHEHYNSVITILGYLEAEGYQTYGLWSSVYWNDNEENATFLETCGFKLTDISSFVGSVTDPSMQIYVRAKKVNFPMNRGKKKKAKTVEA